MLGRPDTARRGNMVSALGMLIAVFGGVLIVFQQAGAATDIGNFTWIAIGLAVGVLVGAPVARLVQMTSMPEMVALFNGTGGLASLLVAWAQLHHESSQDVLAAAGAAEAVISIGPFAGATLFLAALIGGITFTGSIIAWAKLSEKIDGKPMLFPGQNVMNALLLLAAVAGLVVFAVAPDYYWIFILGVVLSLALGVLAVMPIGGADMPVVISLLNSYSGLAACAAGFAINNLLLIVVGALVGASGIVLTRIMCKAMNRSLANVLFSGFGSTSSGGGSGIQGEAKAMSNQDAYYLLEAAQSVAIIPGYGMAVAQAQHAVRELAEILAANGCELKFAIHPVAGRMPGHMNVLLAEANVSYDLLVEMDDINPQLPATDVAIVIGANDTVNPAARDDEQSPIYGMPVINADHAKTVFIMKRSMRSGFAGIDNPLFFNENSYMLFGDAKATVEGLVSEFKD
jgi:NAD(P) transhydrogenase subunit beta